jgi:predicted nuclease of predicted toxin-antitoxin system
MRLSLDHDVDVSLAARLQQRGHDALTTREARHTEAADEQQLIVATAEERVFLTHNRRDFRRLHRHWIEAGRSHAGIIISAHVPIDELERRLLRLFAIYERPVHVYARRALGCPTSDALSLRGGT